MAAVWILAALTALLALLCAGLLIASLRCRPVPDLSCPGAVRGTRWEPYGDLLQQGIASIRSMPWEDVFIRSGRRILRGRLYRGTRERTVLLAHGWRSSGENDFCGITDYYRENGWSILMVDQRGHGQSGRGLLSFGIRERRDMACWLRWIRDNLPGEIWGHGVSMGAVSILGALPLCGDVTVSGVIADSPYDTVQELLIYHAEKRYRFPQKAVEKIVQLEGTLLLGRDFMRLSAAKCVSEAGIPVMVICGTEDRTVPPGMPARYTKGKRTRCYFVQNARHAMCWLKNPGVYERAMTQFLSADRRSGLI